MGHLQKEVKDFGRRGVLAVGMFQSKAPILLDEMNYRAASREESDPTRLKVKSMMYASWTARQLMSQRQVTAPNRALLTLKPVLLC